MLIRMAAMWQHASMETDLVVVFGMDDSTSHRHIAADDDDDDDDGDIDVVDWIPLAAIICESDLRWGAPETKYICAMCRDVTL